MEKRETDRQTGVGGGGGGMGGWADLAPVIARGLTKKGLALKFECSLTTIDVYWKVFF